MMGRRSRKRAGDSGVEGAGSIPRAIRAPEARPAPATPRRRARLDEAPKAPWAPFPLVELCILIALVLIVFGFLAEGPRRQVLLACGFALVTISALELSIREHFAGYRSHTTLLAAVAAVAANIPLFFFTSLPQEVLLAVGIGVFAIAFHVLRIAFQRRAGGLGFRV
jgi:hypothetical protein